jgi:hypothetical protein
MSKYVKISIGLLILGMVGFSYIADLCVEYSTLWYSVIIGSLIMMIVGVLMLWTKWGGRRK